MQQEGGESPPGACDPEAFEKMLGDWIADRSCDGCGFRLGPAPRRMIDKRQYHPSCAKKIKRASW